MTAHGGLPVPATGSSNWKSDRRAGADNCDFEVTHLRHAIDPSCSEAAARNTGDRPEADVDERLL
jgi:hypothetical protein